MTQEKFGLTPREAVLMGFIRSCIALRGVAPSFDEMKAHLGIKSKSGVHRLLEGLSSKGHIQRLYGRTRALRLTDSGVSTVDAITAVLDRCKLSAHARHELRAAMLEAMR